MNNLSHSSSSRQSGQQGQREIRSRWAQETLDILERGQYQSPSGKNVPIRLQVEHTIREARLYRPQEREAIQQSAEQQIEKSLTSHQSIAEIECTTETTLQAAERLATKEERPHVMALNFASARNPGGGFLGGSQAQEESLARSSSLYPSIVQMTEMYEHNRREKSCMYSDYMIYSPEVTIFRNDDGSLREQPYTVSIITAPAVNAGVVRERERGMAEKIEDVMKQRIRYILSVAVTHGQQTLILGAYGCGVFRNRPEQVATWFGDILLNEHYALLFDKIVFAILDRSKQGDIIRPFQQLANRN